MSASRWMKSRSRSPEFARFRRRGFVPQGWGRDWLLEDRCLLTANGPYDFPANTVGSPNAVLFNGVFVPYQKTITITNNSTTEWIYPFIEGEISNSAQAPYQGTAEFDPYDPENQEYRGYVGYDATTNNVLHHYAGLPPLSSITIFVPLAFWDSGRFVVSTDGADQFSTYGGPISGNPAGAPFNFLTTNTQAIYFGSISAGSLNQLNFTPVNNSFVNGLPSTSQWKSPITSGTFQNNQQYVVTGPGLPAGGETVTINSATPNSVTLPTAGTATGPAEQYTFTALAGQSIGPTAHYIQPGFGFSQNGSPITNTGDVMWYHALTAAQPNNDAPFQLNEMTFRGTYYDDSVKILGKSTGFQYLIPSADYPGAILDSADYDLSFVDSINMPVAIEATDATVNNTTTKAPFGWVGSSMSVEAFQSVVQSFSSPNSGTNNNFLGTYFGGKGYPTYVPINPANPKLPAGQNLFLASPAVPGGVADIQYYQKFSDGSVIQAPLYALTSVGSGPSQLSIGGDASHPSQGQDLGLNTSTMANQYALNTLMAPNLLDGQKYAVTYNVGGTTFSAGNAVGLYYAADGKTIIGVKLDQTVPAGASGLVFTFKLPQQDYAAGGIAGLWYSWAMYYANNVAAVPVNGLGGSLTAGSNLLTLLSAAPAGIVPGMAVTTAFGAPTPPGTIILSISTDRKTIQLSTAATGGATSFNFAKPNFAAIPGYDQNGSLNGNTPHVNLSFTPAQQPYALAFAQTVFTAMAAWSVSVPAGTPNAWAPLLTNIIGGNLNTIYLPNANPDVVLSLTNMLISLMQGVPDYTSPLYSNPALWYPDPSLPSPKGGGQTYNVFNLNPYVWFIHAKLGLSAYAFANDDQIGNVNAGGATNVAFSIGGLNGLLNKDPYTPTSNYGVVTTSASSSPAKSSVIGGLTNALLVNQTNPFDYNNNKPGTLVNGPGVPTGTTIQFLSISQNVAQSTISLSNPLTSTSVGPYSFFGSNIFTGVVLGRGQPTNTIYLTSPDAYNTLLKLGPLQNIEVSGEGIDPSKIVTITSLSKSGNNLVVTLSDVVHPALVSQKGGFYAYTFGAAIVPVLRDPGFEWAGVATLSGQFNHGTQLTQNTKDWTFTDSTTNSAWYAGITYGNSGTYAAAGPPPQGLQAGFIQGDSRMSQVVTLGTGTYTLSLLAAQRAASQPAQTLSVVVDGVPVGTIPPTTTTYQPFNVSFTVTGGKHTITLQGTQVADSTVLIDSVAVTPVANTALAANPLPPLLNAIPNQQVGDGSTDSFYAVASSSLSSPTFSLAPGAPVGAAINPSTGLFTWTPTAMGVYPVTVDVTSADSPLEVDAESFTITVGQAVSSAVVVSNLSAPVYGQTLVFGAAVAVVPGLPAPTGTLQFVVDGHDFGAPVPMVNGAALSPAIATLGAGVHHEGAIYSGDATYLAVYSSVLTTTVAQAPLTIVATSAARLHGQPNPLLSASYVGFVNGDTAASLVTPVTLSTPANAFSAVGTYAITAGGASAANYAITFVGGSLAVVPPPAGASAVTQEWTAFTTTLYQEVLGRNPDAAGLGFWVQVLNRGVPAATVALAFWESPERALLVANGQAPQIPFATALQDAQAAGRVAYWIASTIPQGPLPLALVAWGA